MNYGSVCSGIEAASVAWHPLGWKPAWFAEIEPFPSAVLAHHWPEVPNLGDFTAIRHSIAAGELEAPDVLVGGTPCQAFSVAGLRQSLDDKRGQLTLEFVRLANAIDSARSLGGKLPATVVWENVPGVINTPDNAFGCFLGALAGEDVPLLPPGGRWTNAGQVFGPRRAVAWRVLDAQYFGVAQRRRRVFVVASAGGICPEQVLFEFDGVRRDSPPSRQQWQGASADAQGGTGTCSHWDGVSPHPSLTQSHNTGGIGQSNQEIFSQGGSGLVPTPFADCADTLTASMSRNWNGNAPADNGYLFVQDAIAIQGSLIGPADKAGPRGLPVEGAPQYTLTKTDVHAVAFEPGIMGRTAAGHAFHTLRAEGFDGSEDGTGRGAGAVAVAFTSKDYGADASEGLAPTMCSMGHDGSHANGGGQLAVAVGFNARQDPDSWVGRTGPLDTDGGTQAVAVALRGREGGATIEVGDDVGFTLRASQGGGDKPHVMAPVAFQSKQSASAQAPSFDSISPTLDVAKAGGMAALVGMQVRRLTPTECERLQGFLDGHTKIPWRGRPPEDCPDGPRYKALGNSMAVPVMRWIGERVALHAPARSA